MKMSIVLICAIAALVACKDKSTAGVSVTVPPQEIPDTHIAKEEMAPPMINAAVEKVSNGSRTEPKDVQEVPQAKSAVTVTTEQPSGQEANPSKSELPVKPDPVSPPNVEEQTSEQEPMVDEDLSVAQAKPQDVRPALEAADGIPDHKAFDQLLSAHVSASGKVDYKALKGKTLKLDAYLKDLQSNPPQTSWTRDEKLAYWINVYNAYTIKLILNNYPVKSIVDLHDGKPWDVKWIEIANETYSLNNIENDIIRPQFKEPRIHFAVNCAAKSCPPLANKAYTAENLNSLLDKQTKAFINNANYNQLEKKTIKVSKIFDWYRDDFGNIATYVSRYADIEVSPAADVSFDEYDWSLNGM